ncbi:hypothetical protein C8K66_10263 [Pseudomonas sp. GV105]|uniref:hypothetical protein n=1 Tax=Pseudomonas sp. GV105 TaxID=2135759 RepID=UPI000D386A72|nr:hypothetical protein [Pseudomonas sp. GV105]PUB36584.1 hypothetical protein C8K66_10263 [Pseudomonas sp. GV105]
MTDNTELKRLAERVIDLEAGDGEAPIGEAWDEFEAVATPSAVLAQIAENERLRVDLKSVVRLNNENADLFKAKNDQLKADNERQAAQFKEWQASHHANYVAAADERDQLRAEIAGLKTGYEAYERVNAELKGEVEGLRNALRPLLAHWDDLRPGESINVDAARAALGQGEQS